MKRVVLTVLCLCFSLLFVAAVNAEDQKLNIAVVDLTRVMNTYPETKAADAQLEDQVKEFEAEQKDLLDEYRKLREELEILGKEAANRALSEAAREEKRQLAETKLMALKDHERKIQETSEFRRKQINEQRFRMRERIDFKLRGIVAEYAEKKGYNLVLDSAESRLTTRKPVVYRADNFDITEEILKITAPEELKPKETE
ncbi:MAG: OmpH family outer membrane protein [Kiritimatiellia bacterium]|jgi:Skp family chaperone for outer membrane proteins|nr:OmpH family outer membrane protein [Kiritimatiellia bacterium]